MPEEEKVFQPSGHSGSDGQKQEEEKPQRYRDKRTTFTTSRAKQFEPEKKSGGSDRENQRPEQKDEKLRPAMKLHRMKTEKPASRLAKREKSPAMKVRLEDFDILKILDKGSFGKVFLAELRTNGKLYAMKRIRKDILIEKG